MNEEIDFLNKIIDLKNILLDFKKSNLSVIDYIAKFVKNCNLPSELKIKIDSKWNLIMKTYNCKDAHTKKDDWYPVVSNSPEQAAILFRESICSAEDAINRNEDHGVGDVHTLDSDNKLVTVGVFTHVVYYAIKSNLVYNHNLEWTGESVSNPPFSLA